MIEFDYLFKKFLLLENPNSIQAIYCFLKLAENWAFGNRFKPHNFNIGFHVIFK